ncbi:E-selectin-like [Mya arenaria]|uniref:E-selectin-like n=1 Tax=Mya arenaria TaxID=6604 RepID=UPI0022E92613|nr:E-selectin-like [Mya arenaria]
MYSCEYYACLNYHQCGQNGRCVPWTHYPFYYCECDAGYFGNTFNNTTHMHNCNKHACRLQSCSHHGACVPSMVDPYFTCMCDYGYAGDQCEKKVATTTGAPLQTMTSSAVSSTSTVIVQSTTSPNNMTEYKFCLACTDAVSPHTCDHVTKCGIHESCYVDTFVTSMGTLRYSMGCRDALQCETPVSRSRKSSSESVAEDNSGNSKASTESYSEDSGVPIVCSVCCNGSLCNSGGCGYDQFPVFSANTRGPVCFDCAQQRRTDDCDKIRICSRDEVCELRKTTVGTDSEILWTTQCLHTNACPAATSHILVGRKRQSTAGLADNMCCGEDLCNHVV